MKDNHAVQMLSAEIALKGRSLPIYRDVFEAGQLKERAKSFINQLSTCIPKGREVLVIMDAGFGEDWFDALGTNGWYWLVRARGKKYLQLSDTHDWVDARELYNLATSRANVMHILQKKHPEPAASLLKTFHLVFQEVKSRRNCQEIIIQPMVIINDWPQSRGCLLPIFPFTTQQHTL